MDVFDSPFGSAELTDERWNHILTFHPEVRAYRKYIKPTLSDPDIVRRSKFDPSVRVLYKSLQRNKYLAIVVKINSRNFILTAYITTKIQHQSL